MVGPKVVHFPDKSLSNIPACLRAMADSIEAGNFGDAHTLVWVVDCGDAVINVGLMGQAAEIAPTAYYLLGLGKKKLEAI